jgi:hypothetical protein
MHIHLLLIYTSHFIMEGYENAFINVAGSHLEYIRERLAAFIVSQAISSKGEFHFKS